MIPAGARVLVAAKPVDFRKGPLGLMALVRESGADPFSGSIFRGALRVPLAPGRPGEDRLEGRQRCLPVRQAARRARLPVATDRERRDPAVAGAADGADRRHGLDAGEDRPAPAPACASGGCAAPAARSADYRPSLRQDDSGLSIPRACGCLFVTARAVR